jgi:hypothetical protein
VLFGHRARAFSLIIVLICVPALTRAHQTLEPTKASPSFSFRKSVEHPPEKIGAPTLSAITSTIFVADLAPRDAWWVPTVVGPARPLEKASPDSPRGPPRL